MDIEDVDVAIGHARDTLLTGKTESLQPLIDKACQVHLSARGKLCVWFWWRSHACLLLLSRLVLPVAASSLNHIVLDASPAQGASLNLVVLSKRSGGQVHTSNR